MMLDLIIVGAGGFGREMYQWLSDWRVTVRPKRPSYRIKGFLSNRADDLDGFDLPVGILGDPDDYAVEADDRFVLAIGTIKVRKRIATRLKSAGGHFLTFQHPTAVVASSATLGEGVIVCPFATISVNVRLDDFVLVNCYASCGHDATLGKHCVLSPYATVNGFGRLEDDVFMGTHATVTAHRCVGTRASISANSVALSNVRGDSLVQGVPGRTFSILADD
jgi:sugar O-acyltransferase (sialic acid O-acetyltransferase NeuD family)